MSDILNEVREKLSKEIAEALDADIVYGCGYMIDGQFRAWVDAFAEEEIAK